MNKFRIGLATFGAAALSVTALGAPSGAAASNASGNASSNVSSQADSALAYWTQARMNSAVNADTLTAPASYAAEAAAPQASGPVVNIAGATGALGGSASTQGGASPNLIAQAVPRPYTNLPDRTIVKVFFTKATGGNFVCSGTVVNSSTKAMVDTAGHCVADNVSHKFHKNVVVVPAFASSSASSTSRPFGTWTARTLATKSAWINTTSPQFKLDLGYIVVNKLNSKNIVDVVGGQGSRFNASRSQFFNAFGYPQASPFNGLSQFRCNSNRLADDNPGGSGPLAIKIRCDMTGGSSGGGWLVSLSSSTGLGFVNGHNDYKYNNDANSMYSPYYGQDALNLFNFAVGLG